MGVRATPTKSICSLIAVCLSWLASPALAVDGVVEINQARAEAGGVTATDTPGFPVTIDQSGSYRLTGNLTVSSATTEAIEVRDDRVTIDLNGFSIVGPGSGASDGIDAQCCQPACVVRRRLKPTPLQHYRAGSSMP